jgi:hypothetical protein
MIDRIWPYTTIALAGDGRLSNEQIEEVRRILQTRHRINAASNRCADLGDEERQIALVLIAEEISHGRDLLLKISDVPGELRLVVVSLPQGIEAMTGFRFDNVQAAEFLQELAAELQPHVAGI